MRTTVEDRRYIDSPHVKEVLLAMIEQYRYNDRLHETRIREVWHVVMGQMIAQHTIGLRVRKQVLTVHLDSSVLRDELYRAKDAIITMLNKELQLTAIKDMILK